MKSESNTEFENFDRTMRKLVAVPHSEIKAKLDAEKRAKKKRKAKKASASGHASNGKG
jgi:hypothetical protein